MRNFFVNMVFLLIILFIFLGIINNPQISLKGAQEGLLVWFNIVIPSLLPFFIISEILISIGFLDIIGSILDPLMRPIFNLPGIAAFPFSMSIVSGYPTGGKIVSNLRKKNTITKTEGERMLILSSTSGPLFMLGAVVIGMLNNYSLAPLIIYPHYLGAVTMGLLFRFYKYKDSPRRKNSKSHKKLIQFHKNLSIKNNSTIGSILTNSVKNSMNSLLLIGGFIIFYSVVIELLFSSRILDFIHQIIPINLGILQGILAGLLELTTGCKKISSSNMSLIAKISIINFLIGWGGISIHSQVLSFISSTDINGKLYILGKFFHGVLSSIYGLILYKFKYKNIIELTFLPNYNIIDSVYFIKWPIIFTNSIKLAILAILYFLISSIIILLIFCLFSRE